jgi:hypothetical protein
MRRRRCGGLVTEAGAEDVLPSRPRRTPVDRLLQDDDLAHHLAAM